jgi:putative ABC transport system substrate-binding protein
VGFTEGDNLEIEYRWANDQYERLPTLAAELVQQRVGVIFTASGTQTAQAAQAATSTIPVVFVIGTDPVKFKLVASMNRPGGNVTGVTLLTTSMAQKRLDVLREMVPKATRFALLLNPRNPNFDLLRDDVEAAARSIGREILVLSVSSEDDFEKAFEKLTAEKAEGLVVSDDPIFINRRDKLIALAARHRVPTIYSNREVVKAGGLIAYGASYYETFRRAGRYVGEILKGAKPIELPVIQPSKFELVINLKTAADLGLEVPLALFIRADETLE